LAERRRIRVRLVDQNHPEQGCPACAKSSFLFLSYRRCCLERRLPRRAVVAAAGEAELEAALQEVVLAEVLLPEVLLQEEARAAQAPAPHRAAPLVPPAALPRPPAKAVKE
jgi:hypothetical protein